MRLPVKYVFFDMGKTLINFQNMDENTLVDSIKGTVTYLKNHNNQPISTKFVRKALIDGNEELAFSLVPDSTRKIVSKSNYKR